MQARIVVMPGDGIGLEIVPQGVKVLDAVAKRFGHQFDYLPVKIGYRAWRDRGIAITDEEIEICRTSDGMLHGAAGAADSEYTTKDYPPGYGKRQLGRELGLRLSMRPITIPAALADAGPVKPELTRGTDLIVLRDMTLINKQGLATTGSDARGRTAQDILEFSEEDVALALRFAFTLARTRRKQLCLMTQSSLFATSRLWLAVFQELAADYPDVAVEVHAPDNCAMQLMRKPTSYDVIITDNTAMGGMMNNLAALLVGSVGMAPGTMIGLRPGGDDPASMVNRNGLYEPIHGSAPTRAGQDIANPIGTILAAAMLLRFSLGLHAEADAISQAVEQTLNAGWRTYDIMKPGMRKIGTTEMGDRVAQALLEPAPVAG